MQGERGRQRKLREIEAMRRLEREHEEVRMCVCEREGTTEREKERDKI